MRDDVHSITYGPSWYKSPWGNTWVRWRKSMTYCSCGWVAGPSEHAVGKGAWHIRSTKRGYK